jgi:hypothetical protein
MRRYVNYGIDRFRLRWRMRQQYLPTFTSSRKFDTPRLFPETRMSKFQLAQLNIAKAKEPLESPSMADFVTNLDRINALAEQSPGFVWRLKDESGDATAIRHFGDDIIVNMSVWTDVASLSSYAFKSAHVYIMRRRNEWFERMTEAYAALWWVPEGHQPSLDEAKARLDHLRQFGPSQYAFTFKEAFPAPDSPHTVRAVTSGDTCPAD